MARRILATFYAAALAAAVSGPAHAEFGVGADAATRYIWRGLSLDDSFVIQPYLSYATEAGIEIGAWSSWSLTSSGANENDLYVSYSTGPVSITLSDYYFPNGEGTEFFDYSDDAEIHQLEAMVSFASGPLSVTGALIFLGADGHDPGLRRGRLRVHVRRRRLRRPVRGAGHRVVLHQLRGSGPDQRRRRRLDGGLLRLVHPQPRYRAVLPGI